MAAADTHQMAAAEMATTTGDLTDTRDPDIMLVRYLDVALQLFMVESSFKFIIKSHEVN